MRSFALFGLLAILSAPAVVHADDKKEAAPAPTAVFDLGARRAAATPSRTGFTHTGGGNIIVAQPSPDVMVVTFTGVAVAGGHPTSDSLATLAFELNQEFALRFTDEKLKTAKISIEATLIGLLRSDKHGGVASIACPAQASIAPCAGGEALLAVAMASQSVSGGESLSINDQVGPLCTVAPAGVYKLHQVFAVSASHPRRLLPCKTASAEFAPDPALDPLWISAFEPFHGADKKSFGFQVTVRIISAE